MSDKPTRRGFLSAALMAPIAAAVSKWHTPKPEPTFEWTPEIRPLNEWSVVGEEADGIRYGAKSVMNMRHAADAFGSRPLFWREKILKEYPNRPSELMIILGKLRKP